MCVCRVCVVCRVSCVVCRVSCVVCRVSCVVCRVSCVVRRASCVVRRASCVVRRASCVVRVRVRVRVCVCVCVCVCRVLCVVCVCVSCVVCRVSLSGPTARPPYRAVGYSYIYRTYCFSGIAGYRAMPPEFALSQLRGEGGRGYRSSSCPREGIAFWGGVIAEIVSPIAIQWATKSVCVCVRVCFCLFLFVCLFVCSFICLLVFDCFVCALHPHLWNWTPQTELHTAWSQKRTYATCLAPVLLPPVYR